MVIVTIINTLTCVQEIIIFHTSLSHLSQMRKEMRHWDSKVKSTVVIVVVVVVGHLRTRLWWWWLCFVVYQGQSWYQHHLQQLCQVTAHGKGLSVLCHIFIVSLISLLEIWENPSKHTLQKVFSQTKENKKPFNISHKKRWNLETCSFIRANTSEHSNVDSI